MAAYVDIIWIVMSYILTNQIRHNQALCNCGSTFFNDSCYCLPGIRKRNSRLNKSILLKWTVKMMFELRKKVLQPPILATSQHRPCILGRMNRQKSASLASAIAR